MQCEGCFSAFEFFNNGIVMTNRTLRTNELFQVRLDLVIPKWAGSIEIGVTQHSSYDIKFPFKMSNAKFVHNSYFFIVLSVSMTIFKLDEISTEAVHPLSSSVIYL